jgi:hypothetical protein
LTNSYKNGIITLQAFLNVLIYHKPKRKSAGGYIWLKEKEVVKNEL